MCCFLGVVKDWLLIGLSALMYASPVTKVNLVGYSIAFLGVLYYNNMKRKAAQAKVAEQTAAALDKEEGELQPLVNGQRS